MLVSWRFINCWVYVVVCATSTVALCSRLSFNHLAKVAFPEDYKRETRMAFTTCLHSQCKCALHNGPSGRISAVATENKNVCPQTACSISLAVTFRLFDQIFISLRASNRENIVKWLNYEENEHKRYGKRDTEETRTQQRVWRSWGVTRSYTITSHNSHFFIRPVPRHRGTGEREKRDNDWKYIFIFTQNKRKEEERNHKKES